MSLLTPGHFPATHFPANHWNDRHWQDYAYVSGTIIKVFMIRDAGTPTTGLTPIVDLFIKASDGSNVTPIPSIIETSSIMMCYRIPLCGSILKIR